MSTIGGGLKAGRTSFLLFPTVTLGRDLNWSNMRTQCRSWEVQAEVKPLLSRRRKGRVQGDLTEYLGEELEGSS